jgi:subtilisin-like proprotein convertase family protein
MTRSVLRSIFGPRCLSVLALAALLLPSAGRSLALAAEGEELSPQAVAQMRALLAEKEARTPAQRKIGSALLYQMKMSRGEAIAAGVRTLGTGVTVTKGLTLVDIRARVTPALLDAIAAAGGIVTSSYPRYEAIRAHVPLARLEQVAARGEVLEIHPAARAMTQRMADTERRGEAADRTPRKRLRAEERARLSAVITDAINASQGVVTHRVNTARTAYGATGATIKIGVLSDSVDFLAVSQASGDVGPVTVLPGQSGVPGTGEGTAMLEIIQDVAPDAQLFFATAFESPAGFASNILALRAAGCDIIVDDVFYFAESPFQDGIIAQAVNTVTADGALYFSSAGNAGSIRKGTAGVYEGDFVDSATTLPGITGAINRFNNGTTNANNNRIAAGNGNAPISLFWSDPLGASANDYDLFVFNAGLTAVTNASTNVQNGTQDPYEQTGISPGVGTRMVVVKKAAASPRFLHLNTNRGRLDIPTTGQTKGHSAAVEAYSVAATPAATAFGTGSPTGPFPSAFSPASLLEIFSSDGARRVFYNADGSLANPGNPSLLSDGGVVRSKPDLTAADGVSTSVSGFATFFGTSAAAPHAAAIAGLFKSALPLATSAEVRTALTSSAIDIELGGSDINSGAGIVMADSALLAGGALPSALLKVGTVAAAPTAETDNNNLAVDPGEDATLTIGLTNFTGAAGAAAVSATLEAESPGVTVTSGASSYPDIPVGGSAMGATPFTFSVSDDADCGAILEFSLTVTYTGGALSPQTFRVRVPTGVVGIVSTRVSYTGPPVAIPDGLGADIPGNTASVPLVLSGFTGGISELKLSFDGTASSIATGATTVGLDHSFVGDLVIALVSPSGTRVSLVDRMNLGNQGGNNFYNTVLSDAGTVSIQAPANVNPFTGTFKPNEPLAAFAGENPNGTWLLEVRDFFNGDVGNVRAFSLDLRTASCAACPVITLSPASLPAATVGAAYNQTIAAEGGTGPYAFAVSAGTLPPGLMLASATGVVSGSPTVPGSFTFTVTATDALGCHGTATYTVVSSLPGVAISDVTVFEGTGGIASAAFLVTLSEPVVQTVSVAYTTADGTAGAPSDYAARSGSLSFTPGQTVRAVTVMVNGDAETEPTESFFVNLSAAVGGIITDNQGVAAILDDDVPVTPLTISIADTSVIEGQAGTSDAAFVVSLSRSASDEVTVDFASADGTAGAGSDYASLSGTLVFAPGETAKTVMASVLGDTVNETNETFFLNLGNPAGATLADGQAVALILDDDPLLVINDATMTEGNAGVSHMVLVASLSKASPVAVSATFATSNGTALSGSDYMAANGTLTFAPGEVVKLIDVPVIGDNFVEPNETFFVTLSNPVNATVGRARGTATILTDDRLPSITSVTPSTALPGTRVTITGTNLIGTTSIHFNGTLAPFTAPSPTSLSVIVPAAATTGPINVVTPIGRVTSDVFVVQARITTFSPASGGAGMTVNINGAGFTDASSLRFNGTEASFTVFSPSLIRAIVPAAATTGKISVTTGGGTFLSATNFTVTTPRLTSFTPTSGKTGTVVTLTGVNFFGVSSVRFGGVAASFTVLSTTSIRATVPAAAVSGPISVTTGGGTATSTGSFVVLPSVTSVTPNRGTVGAAVTVNGSGFVNGSTAVTFNGISASSVTFVSATAVKAVVPAGATTGPVAVTTPAGSATGPVFNVTARVSRPRPRR